MGNRCLQKPNSKGVERATRQIASLFLLTVPHHSTHMSIMFPARLLAHEEERQIFENEEGSLLEICATSPFFGRDTYFAEGAPLDALIIDDDDDDDANNNNNNAEDIERSMPPSTCFRTSVTNDNKLHWFHVGRAALLTLVFMSMLYSFDCALSAFRDSTTQTSRRSLQFTSIIEAVNEMLNQLQPNLTIIINDDSIVFTESPVTIAPSPIGISNVTMAPSPLLSVLTDESVRTALETASSSELLDDPSSPQGKAFAWMMTNNTHMRVNSTFIIQRYVMVVMDFAFHPDGSNETTLSNPTTHECTWEGVTCGNGTVMSIKWPGKGLGGSIPSEIRFLQSLAVLDLGENTIGGSIPNELYALTSLTTLYLHENALTGPLSEDVGTLYSLVNFYAHNNLLTGTIPSSIGSIQRAGRPLRYLSLASNDFTGTIPSNLRLRSLYYLDLGHNRIQGTIPDDWVDREGRTDWFNLRHLFLNHNEMTGSLPANFTTIGGGRLIQLYLSDNSFTGVIPDDWNPSIKLVLAELHHNAFDSMGSGLCDMAVFESGEMTHFTADCSVCSCSFFCEGKMNTSVCVE